MQPILLKILICILICQIQGQCLSQRQLQQEIVIGDQSEISFSQDEKQEIFVYQIKYKQYLQIKINIKQQYFINGNFRVQLCSSLNKIPRIPQQISPNILQIEADYCDSLNYSLQSSDNYIIYKPDDIKEGDTIYIGVFMSEVQNPISYTLSILQSELQICPLKCSLKGKCLSTSKCQCDNGYIKDDCSIQAVSLKLDGLWKGIIMKGQISYFSVNFQDPTYEKLSSIISIVFQKKVDEQQILQEDNSTKLNGQLSIYYLFKSPDSDILPSNLLTKSFEYMNEDNLNLDFAKELLQQQQNNTILVLAIYSSIVLKQELQVIVTSYEPQSDDSIKNLLFIFFFGGLGLLFIIWLIILAYKAIKKRLINSIRQQQTLLQVQPERRTQRIQPSKLTLSLEIINKYMPVRKYSEIQPLFLKSNKGLAVYCMLTSILSKQQKQNQNDELFLKKQIYSSNVFQSQIQEQTLQNVRLSASIFISNNQIRTKSNLNDSQLIFQNLPQSIKCQSLQDQDIYKQNFEVNESHINISNNFDNSIQIFRVNTDNFIDKEENDQDFEDKIISNEIEDYIREENKNENAKSEEKQEECCLVCLLEFEQENQVVIAICDHIFHSNCLIQWFKSQENCPICRRDLQRRKLRNWFGQKVKKQLNAIRSEKNQLTIQNHIKSIFPQFHTNFVEEQKKNHCKKPEQYSSSRKRSPHFKHKKTKSIKTTIHDQDKLEYHQQSQDVVSLQQSQHINNLDENQLNSFPNNQQNYELSANCSEIQFNSAPDRNLPIQVKNLKKKDLYHNQEQIQNQVVGIQVQEEENEDEDQKIEKEINKNIQIEQIKQINNKEINQQLQQICLDKLKSEQMNQQFEVNNCESKLISSQPAVQPILKQVSSKNDNKQKLFQKDDLENNQININQSLQLNRDRNYKNNILQNKIKKDSNQSNSVEQISKEIAHDNEKQNDNQLNEKDVQSSIIFTHLNKYNKTHENQIQNISTFNLNNSIQLNQQNQSENLNQESKIEILQNNNTLNQKISFNETKNNNILEKYLNKIIDKDDDKVINNILNQSKLQTNKIKDYIQKRNNIFEVKQNKQKINSYQFSQQQLHQNDNIQINNIQSYYLKEQQYIQHNDNNLNTILNQQNDLDNLNIQDQFNQINQDETKVQSMKDFTFVDNQLLQYNILEQRTLNVSQNIQDQLNSQKMNQEIKIRSKNQNKQDDIKTTQITQINTDNLNKLDKDCINIEIIQNQEFSPTVFCLKQNEMFKSTNINQKQKSKTVMRNNNKTTNQDLQLNNNLITKITPINQRIQKKIHDISLIYKRSDKQKQAQSSYLNSSRLVNNTSNVLNSKQIKQNKNNLFNQSQNATKNTFENKSSITLQFKQIQNNDQNNKPQLSNQNILVENLDQ